MRINLYLPDVPPAKRIPDLAKKRRSGAGTVGWKWTAIGCALYPLACCWNWSMNIYPLHRILF